MTEKIKKEFTEISFTNVIARSGQYRILKFVFEGTHYTLFGSVPVLTVAQLKDESAQYNFSAVLRDKEPDTLDLSGIVIPVQGTVAGLHSEGIFAMSERHLTTLFKIFPDAMYTYTTDDNRAAVLMMINDLPSMFFDATKGSDVDRLKSAHIPVIEQCLGITISDELRTAVLGYESIISLMNNTSQTMIDVKDAEAAASPAGIRAYVNKAGALQHMPFMYTTLRNLKEGACYDLQKRGALVMIRAHMADMRSDQIVDAAIKKHDDVIAAFVTKLVDMSDCTQATALTASVKRALLENEVFTDGKTCDPWHRRNIVHALSNNFHICQGPPGTGKSGGFTDILAAIGAASGEHVLVVSHQGTVVEDRHKSIAALTAVLRADSSEANRRCKALMARVRSAVRSHINTWRMEETGLTPGDLETVNGLLRKDKPKSEFGNLLEQFRRKDGLPNSTKEAAQEVDEYSALADDLLVDINLESPAEDARTSEPGRPIDRAPAFDLDNAIPEARLAELSAFYEKQEQAILATLRGDEGGMCGEEVHVQLEYVRAQIDFATFYSHLVYGGSVKGDKEDGKERPALPDDNEYELHTRICMHMNNPELCGAPPRPINLNEMADTITYQEPGGKGSVTCMTIAMFIYASKTNRIDPRVYNRIIVEEAGRVDTALFANFIRALEHDDMRFMSMVIVGDKDQSGPINMGRPFEVLSQKFNNGPLSRFYGITATNHRVLAGDASGKRSREIFENATSVRVQTKDPKKYKLHSITPDESGVVAVREGPAGWYDFDASDDIRLGLVDKLDTALATRDVRFMAYQNKGVTEINAVLMAKHFPLAWKNYLQSGIQESAWKDSFSLFRWAHIPEGAPIMIKKKILAFSYQGGPSHMFLRGSRHMVKKTLTMVRIPTTQGKKPRTRKKNGNPEFDSSEILDAAGIRKYVPHPESALRGMKFVPGKPISTQRFYVRNRHGDVYMVTHVSMLDNRCFSDGLIIFEGKNTFLRLEGHDSSSFQPGFGMTFHGMQGMQSDYVVIVSTPSGGYSGDCGSGFVACTRSRVSTIFTNFKSWSNCLTRRKPTLEHESLRPHLCVLGSASRATRDYATGTYHIKDPPAPDAGVGYNIKRLK